MFLAAILVESKELITIPLKWIHNFEHHLICCYNSGVRRWKKEKNFYSVDKNCDPNFDLDIRSPFGEEDCCYYANILKAFKFESDAGDYVELRRPVLPLNYNENFLWMKNSARNEVAESFEADDDSEGFIGENFPMPIKIKMEDAISFTIPFTLQVIETM